MVEVLGYDLLVLIQVLIVIAGSYLVAKIIGKMLSSLFERTPFPEGVERGIVKTSKYVIYFVGLMIIVTVVGFDLTSIIISLGAFSIAVSFALTNIIQNFVSGIMIQGDKPFEMGDVIRVQAYEGRVVKIGIRTTIIEAEGGDLVHIPNSIFATNPIVNKTRKTTPTSE